MTAARDILCRLSVLGTRVECRGNRLVLCTGGRAVPADLIAAARAAKPELLAMLGGTALPGHARSPTPGEGEHLRELIAENASISTASAEDAQVSAFDERLRANPPKMLTEDAQVSAFDRTEDFRGFKRGSTSKMLTLSRSPRARAAAADPAWWLARHREALDRYRIFHPADEAARLAWGEVEHRWHMAQGGRVPRDLCVGCRQQIDGSEALDMIDGNRVHIADGYDCLTRHGERWRRTATAALIAMGLNPPAVVTAGESEEL